MKTKGLCLGFLLTGFISTAGYSQEQVLASTEAPPSGPSTDQAEAPEEKQDDKTFSLSDKTSVPLMRLKSDLLDHLEDVVGQENPELAEEIRPTFNA